MARIIKLARQSAERFGYKRASRGKIHRGDAPGQMNLFSERVRIIPLPNAISAFDQALMLHERGDDGAGAQYRKAIAEADYPADAWCNLGILESQGGNQKEALACFSKSLQENPGLFETHYNLGNLHFEMGNVDSAKVHYEVARSIMESYPDLHFNLGLVMAISGDIDGAIASLTRYKTLETDRGGQKADDLLERLVESTRPTGP